MSRVRVKMCGMTRIEDVVHAVNLGVDALGFIFSSKSARCISLDKAWELIKELPPFVDSVAVLVNADETFIRELIASLPIHVLQFHGDETPEFCQQFDKPFIKSIPANEICHIKKIIEKFHAAQALILDSYTHGQRGGTGLTFNWRLIPENLEKPYVLAGGLTENNIQDALHQCNPYAVDLCSGIESEPGKKDHVKMTRFIKALCEQHV